MLLFMNHCNDFAPYGPSIGQILILILIIPKTLFITPVKLFVPR